MEGGVWLENGGHCTGRGSIMQIAAYLTGNAELQAIADMMTLVPAGFGLANGGSNSVNSVPAGVSVFADTRQFFFITATEVAHSVGKVPFEYTAADIGLPEFSQDAVRTSFPTSNFNFTRTFGVDAIAAPDAIWKTGYRAITFKPLAPFAVACRLMGAWGPSDPTATAMFNYIDRQMDLTVITGDRDVFDPANSNEVSQLCVDLWVDQLQGAPDSWP